MTRGKKKLNAALEALKIKLSSLERPVQLNLLNTANVIFCTLSSAGSLIIRETNTIEALIIDEAAAACEPETYIPIAAIRPEIMMLVGDPKQLPATIMSPIAKSSGLGRSLQERLMFEAKRPFTMLKIQYRMRPEISRFPSLRFYNGETVDGPNVTHVSYTAALPIYRTLVTEQAFCFVQVDGTEAQQASGSFHNAAEAQQITAILLDIHRRSRCLGNLTDKQAWCHVDRVRIITFYKAQVDLISASLEANGLAGISVSTVDSSQGSEADLVIISFVRTGNTGTIGFLSDDRRLNVALTRAKHKLICVGNMEHGLAGIMATNTDRGRRRNDTETMRAFVQNITDRTLLATRHAIPKVKLRQPKATWVPFHLQNLNHFSATSGDNRHHYDHHQQPAHTNMGAKRPRNQSHDKHQHSHHHKNRYYGKNRPPPKTGRSTQPSPKRRKHEK